MRDYESDFGTSVQGDEDVNFRIPTKLPQALALAEEVASRYFEEGVTFPASALWAGKQSLGTHCLGIASLVCRLFWVTLRLTIVVRAEVRCLVARMCGIQYESDFGASVQVDEDANFRVLVELPLALALAAEVTSR